MKRTPSYLHYLFVMSLLSMSSTLLGDATKGESKSVTCAACHGPNGESMSDIWPNLKGQKRGYLIKQIKAFRDGERNDASMSAMVAQLSDEDITDLADYYSSL